MFVKGLNLELFIPKSSCQKLEHAVKHVNGIEKIKSFFEQYCLLHVIPDTISNFTNSILLRPVIEEMLLSNMAFSQAIEAAVPQFEKNIESIQKDIEIVDRFYVSAMLPVLIDFNTIIKKTSEFCTVTIENIPLSMVIAIAKLGVFQLTEQFEKEPEIKRTIDSLYQPLTKKDLTDPIDPLYALFADPDVESEIIAKLNIITQNLRYLVPIRTIVSVILTKAIKDDICCSDIALPHNYTSIVKEAIELLQITTNVTNPWNVIEQLVRT